MAIRRDREGERREEEATPFGPNPKSMSPPSHAPRRRRLAQNPGTAPHNDSHWQSLSLSSQSVSSCRHFLPYLEWKQSVCFCTHREEEAREGGKRCLCA